MVNMAPNFIPCWLCQQKGATTLCKSCEANRATILEMQRAAMSADTLNRDAGMRHRATIIELRQVLDRVASLDTDAELQRVTMHEVIEKRIGKLEALVVEMANLLARVADGTEGRLLASQRARKLDDYAATLALANGRLEAAGLEPVVGLVDARKGGER